MHLAHRLGAIGGIGRPSSACPYRADGGSWVPIQGRRAQMARSDPGYFRLAHSGRNREALLMPFSVPSVE